MEGIENKYDLPPTIEKNAHSLSLTERRALGIESLPGNFWEAIKVTENSPLVRNALGQEVFDSFIENKRIEWEEYSSQISQYELDRYLPIL